MEEEKYISDKLGRRNPFTVPEGYFEQLTTKVMEQIPDRRPKARRVWMRPVWWAAAAVEGKISIKTPIAQGLLNHKVGDEVEVKIPRGTIKLRIDKITVG